MTENELDRIRSAAEFDLVTQFTCLSSILDDEVGLAVAREMQRVAIGGWVLRSICEDFGSADSGAALQTWITRPRPSRSIGTS